MGKSAMCLYWDLLIPQPFHHSQSWPQKAHPPVFSWIITCMVAWTFPKVPKTLENAGIIAYANELDSIVIYHLSQQSQDHTCSSGPYSSMEGILRMILYAITILLCPISGGSEMLRIILESWDCFCDAFKWSPAFLCFAELWESGQTLSATMFL